MSVRAMIAKYVDWIDQKYPQNYLIQKPVIGSVLLSFYCLLFLIIYRPFDLSAKGEMSFEATMALYTVAMIPVHMLLIYGLRKMWFFSNRDQWSIRKEILAILLILTGLGIFVFAFGFWVEGPLNRLNFATLMDSCKIVFLTCAILYGMLTLINLRYLESGQIPVTVSGDSVEETVHIQSRLKSEAFTLPLSDLLYIESEGNYVVFHLFQNGSVRKEIIRNSISDVEQMLAGFPFIVRTHRAFMVNIKKVSKRTGNSAGYRLQLEGAGDLIPVSRSNVENFDRMYWAMR
ncbi:LytR/AlgR family response regulator transcription factor [Dyadobacter jiangsuensis]|uniref:LytTR family transcriptional regulator n=1 Tax=Dyadobacter jiangsuensis TaxID=1591085 RepID=A0A2P8GIN0_9BACT|nr:LytTR family DNA-binding domain-containing protein [Dyadobacter jiangsuensis]PSL33836.1 LytTR family transcriptional regulator [Dyadobacter jiangsuensis]